MVITLWMTLVYNFLISIYSWRQVFKKHKFSFLFMFIYSVCVCVCVVWCCCCWWWWRFLLIVLVCSRHFVTFKSLPHSHFYFSFYSSWDGLLYQDFYSSPTLMVMLVVFQLMNSFTI